MSRLHDPTSFSEIGGVWRNGRTSGRLRSAEVDYCKKSYTNSPYFHLFIGWCLHSILAWGRNVVRMEVFG